MKKAVFTTLIGLYATHVMGIRHTNSLPGRSQDAMLVDALASGLSESYARINAIEDETDIAFRMVESIRHNPNIQDAVCARFIKKQLCHEIVTVYVRRCSQGQCAILDTEQHPLNDPNPTIRLPNTYQLEAAFYIFKNLLKQYSKQRHMEGKRFRSKSKSNLYRLFMSLLMRKNMFFRKIDRRDLFLSRYLFMTTIYYKTYTTIEKMKTSLQNNMKIARYLCSKRIRKALGNILKVNIRGAVKDTPANYITAKTRDYEIYLRRQQSESGTFTTEFVNMSLDILIKMVTKLQMQADKPWYKKWYYVFTKPVKWAVNLIENDDAPYGWDKMKGNKKAKEEEFDEFASNINNI
ncbi:RAP-1 related antigen (RRA) [Babesia bovis T2Bo]|uniref:RAP-1 related antigen (RRA) n=2 Tax=Babesia bovis TaxID=5865 RepID=A7AS63_BABBO|nr:RAP-1 related antigen (RRA) [Babesia bovis T2Bo]EDO07382.1 RAP-1 related antigen (RRA) [Babesia bovis T2Bo]|eukprot:XP_001610950.1 RAP-1 related antigen (RRA) [Babesia bovis T2Bo]